MNAEYSQRVENGIPVKQRMLDVIRKHSDAKGRVDISPDALAKMFGLNGHDLVKNLEQLRTEGYIETEIHADRVRKLRLKRNTLNEELLRQRRPAHTMSDRIRQWLMNQPQQLGGWLYVTPGHVRDQLGVKDNSVAVAISRMQEKGELEVQRTGARITGMRLVPKNRPVPAQPVQAKVQAVDISAVATPPAPVPLPSEPSILAEARAYQRALDMARGNQYLQIEPNEKLTALLPVLAYIEALKNRVQSS